MSDFLEAVTEAFATPLRSGVVRVECSSYDAESFGNSYVTLVGENLRIRMVRDRDDVFAEIASNVYPNDWFPLQRVIRAVGISPPPSEGLLTPKHAAELVERYFEALHRGLGTGHLDQTRAALADLERFATKRLMDRAKQQSQ